MTTRAQTSKRVSDTQEDSSARLRNNIEKIKTIWLERVRDQLSTAHQQGHYALFDRLPHLLNHLADELSHRPSDRKANYSISMSREYEPLEINFLDYSIDQVILEYHLLRKTIIQVLSGQVAITDQEREIILDSIESRIAEAGKSFMKTKVLAERLLRDRIESDTKTIKSGQDLQEQFISTLIHDLNTPLTSARMCAQLMTQNLDKRDAIIRLSVRIMDDIDRTSRMIRDLLDTHRIRAGEGVPIHVSRINLRCVAQEVLNDFVIAYDRRFILQANEDIKGIWCRESIRRILENLLTNAIKYGYPHTPITIFLGQDKEKVFISVHNEGEPIPEEQQARLFVPFQRAKSAQSSGKKGWGLGLSLILGFAEAHGGTADVKSSKGEGTTFTVTLPRNPRIA